MAKPGGAELAALRALSARVGAAPLLTQAAGGNTSLKAGGTLWIKASGTWLMHAAREDIFVLVALRAAACRRRRPRHWPFIAACNDGGRITPEKLLAAVRRGGGADNEICLELSFREREPTDRRVVEMIRESVDYWAPFVDTGRGGLASGGRGLPRASASA